MSCFICDDKHISALAGYAAHVRGNDSAREIAEILYEANVQSFVARYEGRYTNEIEPFEFDDNAATKGAHAKPVAIIKAAHCFAYQACEFDGWETCSAKKIVDAIVSNATHDLPGYDDAARGAPV